MRSIIRKPAVQARTGLSDRTIARLEQAGKFPERVNLSGNSVGWYDDEVEQWVESRQRGGGVLPKSTQDKIDAGKAA